MGEWAEDAVEGLSDPEPWRRKPGSGASPWMGWYPGKPKKAAADYIWTMKDGEQIRFGDMTPSHRNNCVNMLVRKHGEMVRFTPTVMALVELGLD